MVWRKKTWSLTWECAAVVAVNLWGADTHSKMELNTVLMDFAAFNSMDLYEKRITLDAVIMSDILIFL